MSDEVMAAAERIKEGPCSPNQKTGLLALSPEDARRLIAAFGPLARAHQSAMEKIGRLERDNLRVQCEIIEAYKQLEYLWSRTGSCPCGARRESPSTHSHVAGCPTGKAVELLAELAGMGKGKETA